MIVSPHFTEDIQTVVSNLINDLDYVALHGSRREILNDYVNRLYHENVGISIYRMLELSQR